MGFAIAFAAISIAGAALVTVGVLGMFGRLKPNPIAGIRTPYTFSSEQAWYDTHRFAGPILALGGVAVLATGLAFLPFAAAGRLPQGVSSAVLGANAVLTLVITLFAWLYGTSRARAAAAGE